MPLSTALMSFAPFITLIRSAVGNFFAVGLILCVHVWSEPGGAGPHTVGSLRHGHERSPGG